MNFLERFGLLPTDIDVDQNRRGSDRYDLDGNLEGLGFEALIPEDLRNLSADDINPWIAAEAHELVLYYEVGGESGYRRRFRSPIWPQGASGITIGIGYDLGYNRAGEVEAAWRPRMVEADLARLLQTVGAKGRHAQPMLSAVRDIEIDWEQAFEVYKLTTVLKFGRLTLSAFPGANALHPKCFGALFSLVYNRGSGMRGERRREMRNIRDAIRNERAINVPSEIRNMKHLWAGKGLPGLIKRREAEARLFEEGLHDAERASLMGHASLPSPSPYVRTSGTEAGLAAVDADPASADAMTNAGDGATHTLETIGQYRRVSSLEGRYSDAPSDEGDGDAEFWDGETLEGAPPRDSTLERQSDWSRVHWTNNDALSAEYQHILEADREKLSGKVFSFTAADFDLLARANRFDPEMSTNGKIVFGLRGAVLEAGTGPNTEGSAQIARHALRLREARPDHKNFRCVIGVYDVQQRVLSGYIASTVPNRYAVSFYARTQKSGNMLPAGCYRYAVGRHRTYQGCLRQHQEFAVYRNVNNLAYEIDDKIVAGTPFDNIHPAFADRYNSADFSSFGCQVIRGTIASGNRHSGEWRQFRDALGLNQLADGDHGRIFHYMLLTGLEAAIAADMRETRQDANLAAISERLGRLRQGSKGAAVKSLQAAIGATADGDLGAQAKAALWQFQNNNQLAADGIYAPALDEKLGLYILRPAPIALAGINDAVLVAASLDEVSPTSRLENVGGRQDLQPLDALYLELGRRARAADSDPNWIASDQLESLESFNLENTESLIAYGKIVFRRVERSIYELVCGDNEADARDRGGIIDALSHAATNQATGHDTVLTFVETFLLAKCYLIPPINKIVARILVEEIVGPAIDDVRGAAAPFAKLACQRWSQRITGRDAANSDRSTSRPPSPALDA